MVSTCTPVLRNRRALITFGAGKTKLNFDSKFNLISPRQTQPIIHINSNRLRTLVIQKMIHDVTLGLDIVKLESLNVKSCTIRLIFNHPRLQELDCALHTMMHNFINSAATNMCLNEHTKGYAKTQITRSDNLCRPPELEYV